MRCENCGSEHDGIFGSGKYCSRSCANSRGPRSESFKKAVSDKLRGLKPWNTGATLSEEHKEKIAHYNRGKIRPRVLDEEAFIKDSKVARHVIKKRIIQQNLLDYVCSCCGQNNIWNDKLLILQLDHINGINNDHRIENLRFLCPNCHTQQETYAAKNRVRQKNITE